MESFDFSQQLASLPDHIRMLIASHASDHPARPPMQEQKSEQETLMTHESVDSLERTVRLIPSSLKERGLIIVDGFLSSHEVSKVKAEAKISLEEGGKQAGMGGGGAESRWIESSLRGDRMRWCHADQERASGRENTANLIDYIHALKPHFTQMGYDVGGRITAQLACYPGGGSGYVRHSDHSASAPGRTLTAIIYLQDEPWMRSNGGQLSVYHGVLHSSLGGGIGVDQRGGGEEPCVSISPVGGRLVIFESWIDHEVMPSLKERWALTCWLYKSPPPSPPIATDKFSEVSKVSGLAPKLDLDSETIFVSIASYRDFETRWTIYDLFQKASRPKNVFVAIVWQVDRVQEDADLMKPVGSSPEWLPRMREIVMDYREAEGPCLARHLAQQLWRGERYHLQLDSHMRFVQGWDDVCLQQLHAAESLSQSERVVLSTYPPDYHGFGASASIPDPSLAPVPLLCAQKFNEDGFLTFVAKSMERSNLQVDSPVPSLFWAAGFSFSRSSLIKEVPYPRELPHLFFGEEVYMLARMWTRGWRFYAPSLPICYHKYERSSRPHTFQSDVLKESLRRDSQEKVLRVLGALPLTQDELPEVGWRLGDTWGLGSDHDFKSFQLSIGVDFRSKSISEKATWGGREAPFIQG